jgi:hypothetical protein
VSINGEEGMPRQPLRAFVIRYIYEGIGFIPVHVPTLQSEAEIDARSADLPLILLWNEQDLGDRWSFQTWVNWGRMMDIARLCDAPPPEGITTDQMREELARTFREIHAITTAAVYDLTEKAGRSPSQICEEY